MRILTNFQYILRFLSYFLRKEPSLCPPPYPHRGQQYSPSRRSHLHISGKRSENRPAFQRIIGEAKENPPPFDVILLWKFSRFARNQEESIVYKALLRKQYGVDVISVSEPLSGGPFASLIERIIEWFDEFYSIRLSQEVKRTMKVKAERGELQSTPSFGYRVHMEPGQKSVLEVVPEEARKIQEAHHTLTSPDASLAEKTASCATLPRASSSTAPPWPSPSPTALFFSQI